MANQYKTKDGQDYVLPGIGATTGGIIETDQVIENSNFELVNSTENQQAQAPVAQPAVQPAPQAQVAQAPAIPAAAPAVQQTYVPQQPAAAPQPINMEQK